MRLVITSCMCLLLGQLDSTGGGSLGLNSASISFSGSASGDYSDSAICKYVTQKKVKTWPCPVDLQS